MKRTVALAVASLILVAAGASAIVLGERQNLENVEFELESVRLLDMDLGSESTARSSVGDDSLSALLLNPSLGTTLAEAALPGLSTAWAALRTVQKAQTILEHGSVTIAATLKATNPTFMGARLDPVSAAITVNGAQLTVIQSSGSHAIPSGQSVSVPLDPIVIPFSSIVGGLAGIIRDDFQMQVTMTGQYRLETWVGAVDLPISARLLVPLVPQKPTLRLDVVGSTVTAMIASTSGSFLDGSVRWGVSEPVFQRPVWPVDSSFFNFLRLHAPGLMRSSLFDAGAHTIGPTGATFTSSLTSLTLGKEYALFFFWAPDLTSIRMTGVLETPLRQKPISTQLPLGATSQAIAGLAYLLLRDLGHLGASTVNTIPSVERVWWTDSTGSETQSIAPGSTATAHLTLKLPIDSTVDLQVWRDVPWAADSAVTSRPTTLVAPGGELAVPFTASSTDGRGYFVRLFIAGQEYQTVPGMDDPLGVSYSYPPRLELRSSGPSPSPERPSTSPNPSVSDAWWENTLGSRITQAAAGQTVLAKVSFTVAAPASCTLEVWRDLAFAIDTMVGQKPCSATTGANLVGGQFVTESGASLRGYYVVFRVDGQELFTVPGMNSVTDYSYPPRLAV